MDLTRTGIQERRIAGKHITTSAMAVRAARAALETAALQPAELDYIISSTSTHEYACPPQAALVGQALGVQKGFCFDLNAACCLSGEYLASALQKPSPFYFVRLRAALARRGPEILRT